jgi:Mitochondrial carrier protein
VRAYGWKFIPEQVLPPLLANVAVGAALYTSYLQILARLHEPSAQATNVVFPPPSPSATMTSGLLAGGIQSFIAAPLDALQVRFEKREERYQHRSMWHYGREKLHDIGLRGIFAGWGLSFVKDSLAAGVFFSTFEYVKAQGYYSFVHWYYKNLGDVTVDKLAKKRGTRATNDQPTATIKPHYAFEPGFLFLAGISASFAQQAVIHPLGLIQTRHYERLEDLDTQAKRFSQSPSKGRMLRAYYHAYQETWKQCQIEAIPYGSMRRWLFHGFWWSTIRQVPSTSAGLIIFELVRRKYGLSSEEVRISQDGYDILLT